MEYWSSESDLESDINYNHFLSALTILRFYVESQNLISIQLTIQLEPCFHVESAKRSFPRNILLTNILRVITVEKLINVKNVESSLIDECNEELAKELEKFTFFPLYTFLNRKSQGKCMSLAWCCPLLLENTKWVTKC